MSVSATIHVLLRQKVAGVDGCFGSKPNLRPAFKAWNGKLRWKEGHPLHLTAVVVSSSDAKGVAMLSNHSFWLPYMPLCAARRLPELMVVFAPSQIRGPILRHGMPS